MWNLVSQTRYYELACTACSDKKKTFYKYYQKEINSVFCCGRTMKILSVHLTTHHFLLVSDQSTLQNHYIKASQWRLRKSQITIYSALLLVETSQNLTTTSNFQDEYYSLHTSLSYNTSSEQNLAREGGPQEISMSMSCSITQHRDLKSVEKVPCQKQVSCPWTLSVGIWSQRSSNHLCPWKVLQ